MRVVIASTPTGLMCVQQVSVAAVLDLLSPLEPYRGPETCQGEAPLQVSKLGLSTAGPPEPFQESFPIVFHVSFVIKLSHFFISPI